MGSDESIDGGSTRFPFFVQTKSKEAHNGLIHPERFKFFVNDPLFGLEINVSFP